MPQAATIKSLPRAFRMMKAMQGDGAEWNEDYRHAAADALKTILSGRMETAIDRHLATMATRQEADRRNGCYHRHLLTPDAFRLDGGAEQTTTVFLPSVTKRDITY